MRICPRCFDNFMIGAMGELWRLVYACKEMPAQLLQYRSSRQMQIWQASGLHYNCHNNQPDCIDLALIFPNKGAGCCTSSSSDVSESDTTVLYLSTSMPLLSCPLLRFTTGQARRAGSLRVLLCLSELLAAVIAASFRG